MIANIHPYDVAQVISANANISAVLPGGFWAWIPDKDTPGLVGTYAYMSITTDNTTFRGMNAPMIKQAIVSINVVCAVDPSPDENTVLYNAIGTITNEIVSLWCDTITDWWNIDVLAIEEQSPSPVWYNNKNRAIISKPYLFSYNATDG